MTELGDSGALICDTDYNVAVGMFFAGSSRYSALNPMHRIEDAMGVRIAVAGGWQQVASVVNAPAFEGVAGGVDIQVATAPAQLSTASAGRR
jgi:hypothetical protein